MAAIVIGRKADYPKRQRKSGRFYFRQWCEEIEGTDTNIIVETTLVSDDPAMAASQINDYNQARGYYYSIDETYFYTED